MGKKAKAEPYAVAFIDFLGVKDMISHDEDGNILIIFRAACKAALKMCREILGEGDVTIKMFSDNVVLCRRVYNPVSHTDDALGAIKKVVAASSMFQYFILDAMGTLVRGGLTVGELYIDNIMVWGQALVDTYRLESEVAVHPRIVISPALANSDNGRLMFEKGAFARDNDDGLYYLDYINLVWKVCKVQSCSNTLDKFIATNQAELDKHGAETIVGSKQLWQREYLQRMSRLLDNCSEEENKQITW